MEVKECSLPGCSLNREHFVRVLFSELIHHFIQLMTELDPKNRERKKCEKKIIKRTQAQLLALGNFSEINVVIQVLWYY